MSKKMLTVFSALLVLVWPLIGGTLKDKGSTHVGTSHVSRVVAGNGAAVETDALVGPQNVRLPGQIYRFQGRDTADTLFYDLSYGAQFIQSPGDAMMTVFQMPADGIIKGVNVPIYEWGTGDQQMTLSLHAITYPYRSDGTTYPSSIVDAAGWIGGYDMDATTGYMSITGTTYTPGGTVGICNAEKTVAANAQDPLGDTPGTGTAVSTMGLLWPDGFVAATLDPTSNPAQQDNWLATADFGTEPTLNEGDWVGILVASTGAGGGDDPPTGFYYADGTGAVEPWVSLKFYDGCGGTSGNGGWHIRHWVFDFELAVLLTGDRGPVMTAAPVLPTTLSTADRDFTTSWTDDNPSGGSAGVATVTFNYMLDSTTATVNSITLTLTSGDAEDGTWSGTVPGQSPGTTVYYYLTAVDVGGKSTTTPTYQYSIFEATEPNLFFYNASDYGSFIAGYYLYGSTITYNFWDGLNYGAGSTELYDAYDGGLIMEITGSGPAVINNTTMAAWLGAGKGDYILTGDEWLGAQTGWVDTDYEATDFQEKWLGVDADHNDINYATSGDQGGISRLLAVDGDAISGDLAAFLADSLDLNYDPNYELGFSNWLDGVDPVDAATVAFYGVTGVIDDDTTGWFGADTFASGIYQEHGAGSDVVFLAFDPLATNTEPSYHWIGIMDIGPLASAVAWTEGNVSVDKEVLPTSFALKGNYPNPFNPSTNIAFTLDVRSDVTVRVYSLLGKEVATLHSGNLTPGLHSVKWNGLDNNGLAVASGVYLYRVEAGSRALTGKMMLLK